MGTEKRVTDEMTVAAFRARLSEQLHRCHDTGRVIAITHHGKPKAVLMGYAHYMGLVRGDGRPPRRIELSEWKKNAKSRQAIVDSIASFFDVTAMKRKGQKKYKRHAVRNFGKIATRS